MNNPGPEHVRAAKRILRYIAGTRDYGLKFDGNDSQLFSYFDSNWGGDREDERSTTGWIFYLASAPISWRSTRQPTVAISSTEAEYMSMASATQEAIWLRMLLQEMGFPQPTTIMYGDNNGCMKLAENPIHRQRTKHINIKVHFLREYVKSEDIRGSWLPSRENVADALTESLGVKLFQVHRNRMITNA